MRVKKITFFIQILAILALPLVGLLFFFYKPLLLSATLISVLNLSLIIYVLSLKAFEHPLYKIFFLWHTLTLVIPIFIVILFYPNYMIEEYLYALGLTEDDYFIGNLYIILFDGLMLITIIFLSRFQFKMIKKPYSFYIFNANTFIIFLCFLAIAYSMKIYLVSIGVWFVYEIVDMKQYGFATYANLLSQLDLVPLLYFAYKKWRFKRLDKWEIIMIILIIVISGFFAVISTSKAKVFMLIIPVIMILLFSKHKVIYISLVLIGLSIMPTFFNYMMFLRTHSDIGIISNTSDFISHNEQKSSLHKKMKDNIILGRLDYQKIVAKTVLSMDAFPVTYRSDYLDNFISFIPRFLWKDKPTMGLDQNQAGKDIGVITQSNMNTAIGLSPVGEAYHQLGFIGIVLIAIFMGILLWSMSIILNYHYWPGFLLSFYIAIMIGKTNTTVILPSIVKIYIIFYIFSIILNNKIIADRKLRIKF